MSKYYSSNKIREIDAYYYLIIGERSNGKTYDAIYKALTEHVESGYKDTFALVRRWKEDMIGRRGDSMFSSLECNGDGKNVVSKITKGKFDRVVYRARRWYLGKWDSDIQKTVREEEPFCYGFALSDMEHDKGASYPTITTIIFDEFITRVSYLRDEFTLFMNVVSTIVRKRRNVKIFMLANTVDKYNPYFDEFGLTNAKNMKQGTIEVYKYGEKGFKLAIEYCAPEKKSKTNESPYFAFDNPALEMITGGAWEVDMYPHCPIKFRPKDILYTYFICYYDEILQCEIVLKESNYFTYIHRKTTPLKDEENDIIFSPIQKPLINWHTHINKPAFPIHEKIWRLFKMNKVFYQDNTVGETVRSYLKLCESN